ncbi:MAG: hypothetical protein H0X13_15450 [Ramlibacter sp.]|nr:hypothetical protein [Ramlibacter sp.]
MAVLLSTAFTSAYADYAALQAGVIDWSQRDDLASKVPAFIELAERAMFREVALRATQSSEAGTSSGDTITLPDRLNAIDRVELTAGGVKYTLNYTSPNGIEALTAGTGLPSRYTIQNGAIRLISAPAAGYSYTLFYRPTPAFLSPSLTSNAILANHPDLYLWGSLTELARYIMDNEMEGKFLAAYVSAVASVRAADERLRFPASGGMQIKPRNAR